MSEGQGPRSMNDTSARPCVCTPGPLSATLEPAHSWHPASNLVLAGALTHSALRCRTCQRFTEDTVRALHPWKRFPSSNQLPVFAPTKCSTDVLPAQLLAGGTVRKRQRGERFWVGIPTVSAVQHMIFFLPIQNKTAVLLLPLTIAAPVPMSLVWSFMLVFTSANVGNEVCHIGCISGRPDKVIDKVVKPRMGVEGEGSGAPIILQ